MRGTGRFYPARFGSACNMVVYHSMVYPNWDIQTSNRHTCFLERNKLRLINSCSPGAKGEKQFTE